ncbi:hypothetical protein BOX15_Mlig023367g1 [Macrostomum lignano]|uniref:vitamin-K-epoxide reductase (warfarin-sensitive) n=2 Tax=Macrostomum lignano TaxID=282301 RepID=A0A1I8J4K6_9PLAT|nr:hypothetical protein BOX15_Mlig023367g2 [Macrostomum lignano]PAA84538.1 hypothetical protein BOX15_Mlig023367g3 [Macrostomum lignano]PAA93256.1 hypothetical protein BOX15_Mlig023367g1 [Macrostomum lignano]
MGKAGVLLSVLLDLSRLALAIYSIYVTQMINTEPKYKAQCDISDYVSCSKTFTSKYGKGFGLIGDLLGEKHPLNQPNGIYGSVFYVLHLLLVLFFRGKIGMHLRVLNSLALTIGCGWLAYTLVFVIKHMCIVCVPMYCLNVLSLLADIWQLRSRSAAAATAADARKKKK